MDNHLLTILKVELLSQAELAQVAGEQLDAAHEKKLEGRMRRDDEFWVALQSILTIAGNASKLLWGSWGNEATAARRQPLRELVGVSDNSPLRSRDMRNAFEHFDAEVETWHRAGESPPRPSIRSSAGY